MAKKYLSLDRLTEYDALIKAKIDSDIENHAHSWNDLEDRPFYKADPVENVLIENKTTNMPVAGANRSVGALFPLEDGRVYKITYNGVEYVCTAYTSSSFGTCIGNVKIKMSTESGGNEEPFFIYNETEATYICGNKRGDITFSIVELREDYVTLSEKFIPDTIARTQYLDENFALKSDLQKIDLSKYLSKIEAEDVYESKSSAYQNWNTAMNKIDSNLETAKAYTDEKVSGITNGDVIVKEAEHSTNADSATNAEHSVSSDSATKATQDASGNVITTTYETKADASAKLAEAKGYADTAATTAANKVKDDLLNGAGEAYDTLKELGDLIDDNKDAIDVLEDIASGKADATHTHAIADVSGLQSALDGKAAASHGTHVTFDSTNKPKMDGTAAFGTSTSVARADHVHPTDTSRASQSDLDALETVVSGKANASHTHAISDVTNLQSSLDAKATTSALNTHANNADIHFTAAERTKLSGIAEGANKTTVDTALSSTSTNPVQNKVVNSAITSLTSTVSTNTSAISSNTSAISALQTKVDSWSEITSSEIQALFA